ncbi:glycosyltransferase family 2 protein [Neobacillus drentensis]|uniref:glycosyltransferase family 2 protein n=1 Tax=Neobacillus drentensis TaxID=220684 RepID=UPI003002CBBA
MIISVLVPTYNAEPYIIDLIDRLKAQELMNDYSLEIIIIDSSSTDNTVNIVKNRYPEIYIETINNRNFNHGTTRNYLASIASGEYLVFMTQDAIPRNNRLIMNLWENLQSSDCMISYAKQVPRNDASILEQFARSFNYPHKKVVKDINKIKELGIKTFFNSNVCSMYKAELFKSPYNGFPNDIILNEDMILASKVIFDGKKVVYEPNAEVYHSHNYNLKQQFKRYFDIGMAFNETSFLLEHVSNEKEGMRMVTMQIKYLLSKNKAYLIPYCVMENAVKLISYNLGKRYTLLPRKLKSKWSAYSK